MASGSEAARRFVADVPDLGNGRREKNIEPTASRGCLCHAVARGNRAGWPASHQPFTRDGHDRDFHAADAAHSAKTHARFLHRRVESATLKRRSPNPKGSAHEFACRQRHATGGTGRKE